MHAFTLYPVMIICSMVVEASAFNKTPSQVQKKQKPA
jgi:hypothetical protein